MFRTLWLVGVIGVCFSGQAYSATYQLNQLVPLQEHELSNYRGGFKFNDDFMVNIGLSIRTSINGEMLFTNHIANLTIQNGRLTARQQRVAPTTTTVVQVGGGNSIALPVTSVTPLPANDEPEALQANAQQVDVSPVNGLEANESQSPEPQVNVSQTVAPLPQVNQTSITSIIQNSLDNTVLGFDTVINVDAQVGGVMKQIERSNKLQQALQFSFQ
ncbi:hypothetical protein VSVS12_03168 [Vibrio scophthalmi]|uniref:hypothetical protein n=1 Tax=Vibrio scophthalmi TaxID=45658 RepID=UPI0008096CE7|nr:hypothetical protein [Vibrio scophthalmi]ANS86877.1 hypothetical protein VSVS12_03168 [Vibrio scophthalmi]